jgi:cytochrome c oxidase assembly protein subunit 11
MAHHPQIATWVLVFGLSYLMVPLYRIFCAMTGVTGDVQVKNQTLLDDIDRRRQEGYQPKRRYTVTFTSATARELPWSFVPLQKEIEFVLGCPVFCFLYSSKIFV